MRYDLLKDYLKNVYLLEMSINGQITLWNKIQNAITICESQKEPQLIKKVERRNIDKEDFQNYAIYGGIIGPILIFALYFLIKKIRERNIHIRYVGFNIEGTIIFIIKYCVIGVVLGVLIAWIILALISIKGAVKNNKSNKAIDKENLIIRQKQSDFNVAKNNKVIELKKELNIIGNSYAETKQILNQYYSLDVIYPKYRNFIAISSFYEYLCSGRCDKLEGHEGAYNIFEQELRQEIIIDKLDVVIKHLEDIKHIQHKLYEAILKSNTQTEIVIKELNRTVSSLKRIENNQIITNYNSAIVAQNSGLLKHFCIYGYCNN